MMSHTNHTPSSTSILAMAETLNFSATASTDDDHFGQDHRPSVLFEFIIPGVLLNTIGEVRTFDARSLSSNKT